MPENITNCPHCKEHCPLDNPGCGRGERYARELRGEVVPEEGREREHHEHGERDREGRHGGHHHHHGRQH